MDYAQIPSEKVIQKTSENLIKNGFAVEIIGSGKEAKKKAFDLISKGAEVMTMTSVTLDTIGLTDEINQSSQYVSLKNKLYKMSRSTESKEMQKLGAAPEYAIGSVHALTMDGKVLIASNTGSQLPAYAYGSEHVIWIVGAQKIVKNLDEGIKRIHNYVLPLESERAKKAYGVPGSNVSKLLIINKEINPNRITILLVKKVLGF